MASQVIAVQSLFFHREFTSYHKKFVKERGLENQFEVAIGCCNYLISILNAMEYLDLGIQIY